MMFLPLLEQEAGVCFETDVISVKNYWKQLIAQLEKQNHVNPSLPVFLLLIQIVSVAISTQHILNTLRLKSRYLQHSVKLMTEQN